MVPPRSGQSGGFCLRAIAIVLLATILGSIAVTVHAASPTYEGRGTYAAGNPVGYLVTSCDLSGEANDVWSSCRSLDGANVDGLVARVRDEAITAPATQAQRVCFFSALNYVLDCPPDEGCPDWSWCAHVPDGTRLYGVTSATGANVEWHLTIG